MLAFHPYGEHDIRVVSDLSRFDFENAVPRNRSRNTTPTSIKDDLKNPPRIIIEQENEDSKSINLATSNSFKKKFVASSGRGDYDEQNAIYQYYMPSENNVGDKFTPYPSSITDARPANNVGIPKLPGSRPNYQNKELPPIQSEAPMPQKELPPIDRVDTHTLTDEKHQKDDIHSLDSKQKDMELMLMKNVMHVPLFQVPLDKIIDHPRFRHKTYTVTANFVLYVFEVVIAIVVITLLALLASKDDKIGSGFYHYFIADQSISLITSFLFITTIINFERRNGSFYCTAACILTFVSFVMVLTVILVRNNCPTTEVCNMRKAVSSFIIISTFLWFWHLVTFLTTLYISRLNLLEEINFDYSEEGVGQATKTPVPVFDSTIDPQTGRPWPQFFMQPDGEIVDYDGSFNTEGLQRLIVYVPHM